MHIYVHMNGGGMSVPQLICGGQRATCRSFFSHPVDPDPLGLVTSVLASLSCLTALPFGGKICFIINN